MKLRIAQLGTALLAFAPSMAAPDVGVSRNEGELRRTIIGTYLARNAGTGLYQNSTLASPIRRKMRDSEVLQRLLELEHSGRTGLPYKIVNEAVAAQAGYVCPSYNQLPPAMRGCSQVVLPQYYWKSVTEVRLSAQQLGFACGNPTDDDLTCTYQAKFSQHPVRFIVKPSIDGLRTGHDRGYEITAEMHFEMSDRPTLTVREAQLEEVHTS